MSPDPPPAAGAAEPELGVLEDLVGYHLRRADNLFVADFARTLGDTGLSQVLFGILSLIARNPGIGQGAAGRLLGIQRANMVSLVTRLAEAGLVERRIAEGDRRAFSLTLTSAGEATFAAALAKLHAHEAALLARLSAAERNELIGLLRRIGAR